MEDFYRAMKTNFGQLSIPVKKIITEVWEHKTEFIRWPSRALLLWEGCVRTRYHNYPEEIRKKLRSKRIPIDSRSNGPAIMAYLYAGGERPKRTNNQGWAIHHVYNGKFPLKTNGKTLHAVKEGKHFTQSAGLVAMHPIAHALADEYFYFAWLLRHEAFLRFGYDPDNVFAKKIDAYGFKIT